MRGRWILKESYGVVTYYFEVTDSKTLYTHFLMIETPSKWYL